MAHPTRDLASRAVKRRSRRTLAGGPALPTLLLLAASADAAEKAATLDIIGSDGGATLDFNFDGYLRGANIPNPKSGINRDHRSVTFGFLADRPGRYAMVCEVIGHDDLGMWDELDVVDGLKRPAVLVK